MEQEQEQEQEQGIPLQHWRPSLPSNQWRLTFGAEKRAS